MKHFMLIGLSLPMFLSSLFVLIGGRTQGRPPDLHRHASGAMEALDFWTRSRAYPFPDIPPGKFYTAFQLSKRRFAAEPHSVSSLGAGWSSIGPENLSGRMISVALNPVNPSTIYAGSASGGLWRSRTGGVAGDWQRIAIGYPVLGVGAIAIAPADSNVIYIGTGEVYRYQGSAGGLVVRTTRGSYGMGILKSTDGGTSWTKSLDWSYQQQRGVQSIKIHPLRPSIVWAATTDGIYKSIDAGATWAESIFLFMGEDIILHPTDTNRVMISTGNLDFSAGIFRTSDGGSNWEQVNPIGFSGKTLLDSPPAFPEVVFASIADSTTGVGSLWKSTNFGTAWTQQSSNATHAIFGVQGWYSHYVAVYPTDPNIVFHASVSAGRSTNGGVLFSGTSGLYSDNHDFAYDPSQPDILYSANDDGIYRSTNFGSTFSHVSDGLGTGQLYNGLSSSQSDSVITLGQSQDHIPGYLYQGSGIWVRSASDEAGWTAINPLNDSIMYAMNRYGGNALKSTDRGATFNNIGGFSTTGAWNAPIIIAPSSPSTLYVGKTKVFKSTNAGASWAVTNSNLNLDGNPAISIAISSTSPDTVFIGTGPFVAPAHVLRTTDGGGAWTIVSGLLPDRYPLDLAVDPANSRTVYAAFGGYGTGHVFKSTDAGGSWSNIDGTLPDLPATALLVDPQYPSIVYLGTDIGVYVSTNGGGSWNSFQEGLPDAVLVSDLNMTASNRTLRVATHGNGVFSRRMPAVFPSITQVIPAGGESWEVGTVHYISWEQALIPSARLEYSTDNGATWNLIAANVMNQSSGYAWTIPPVLTSAGRIRVRSTSDTTVSAQSAGPFTIFINGSVVQVHSSWNLVSLPVAVADHSRTALFPSATTGAFTFETSYARSDTILDGKGYWLKFGSDEIVSITGTTISEDSLGVHKGWNLIGSLSATFATASILQDPPGIVSSLYYGYDGTYSAADSIRPGRGYWVKCGTNGRLLTTSDVLRKTDGSDPLSILRQFGSLTCTDADGHSQRLYFGVSSQDLVPELFVMPPAPPLGSFDARFASNLLAELFDLSVPKEVPILLSSCRYPVTFSWTGEQRGISLRAGSESVALEGTGSMTVKRQGTAVSLASAAPDAAPGIPDRFALHQNYPNPFNPSTVIGFDLPHDGAVQLSVFTLLGEEIGRLVDERKTSGFYSIRWNAENHPSGVYLARLTSGGMTSTVKLLLMK